jgi:Big-like domain-containing protein
MNRKSQSASTVALALFILACSDGIASDLTGVAPTDPETDAARLASITVTLPQSSIVVGKAVQAKATLRDRWNHQLSWTVTWSSSNPAVAEVSSSGMVTGRSPGSASIIASRGTKTGSASLAVVADSVSSSPTPVASVTLSLGDSSLSIGQTTQGSAIARDSSNNVLTGRSITWISSNPGVASVSSSGLVTALATGSSQITATSEGKSAGVSVAVADTATSTPPPDGSVEPAGLTTLTERPFSALNEDGWTNTGSSYYSIKQDATAPKSPSSVGQILFPAGFGSGNAPAVLEKVWSSGVKTLYVSFWLKLSSNWVGNDASVNKIFHFWIGDSNRLFLNAHGAGNGTLTAEVWLQGIVAGGNFDSGRTADFGPNQGASGVIKRGQWVHWEMLFTGNSSGAADGKVEWWVDGAKVGSYSGIQFVSGAGTWQEMEWSPTYGGSGSPVPADQTMSVDHIRISGK